MEVFFFALTFNSAKGIYIYKDFFVKLKNYGDKCKHNFRNMFANLI